MAKRFTVPFAVTALVAAGLVAPALPASAAPKPPGPVTSPQSGDRVALGPATSPVPFWTVPDVPKGTGPVRNGTFLTYRLTDRLVAQIDVGSGNLLVRSQDLTLPGVVEGVVVGAAYNSLLVGTNIEKGSLGNGWRTRSGVDVKLFPADNGDVTYVAADGAIGVFTPLNATGYNTPGEFKATLAKAAGGGWALTEHDTGRVYNFTSSGLLDSMKDRNGNVTDVSYDASDHETSIVSDRGSTAARTGNVTYASNGLISKVTQNRDGGGAAASSTATTATTTSRPSRTRPAGRRRSATTVRTSSRPSARPPGRRSSATTPRTG